MAGLVLEAPLGVPLIRATTSGHSFHVRLGYLAEPTHDRLDYIRTDLVSGVSAAVLVESGQAAGCHLAMLLLAVTGALGFFGKGLPFAIAISARKESYPNNRNR